MIVIAMLAPREGGDHVVFLEDGLTLAVKAGAIIPH